MTWKEMTKLDPVADLAMPPSNVPEKIHEMADIKEKAEAEYKAMGDINAFTAKRQSIGPDPRPAHAGSQTD